MRMHRERPPGRLYTGARLEREPPALSSTLREQRLQPLRRRFRHTALSDEPGHQPRRSDVERRIGGVPAFRRDPHANDRSVIAPALNEVDFVSAALLDRNLLDAVMNRPIDGW